MPRFKTLQTRFTQGELDPLMIGRVDVDQYYGAAQYLRNVFTLPQGGVKRRPGLEFIHRIPGVLTTTAPSSATAPNGGTEANGYDDNTANKVVTTTNIGVINPYVVLRYDMGSAKALAIVYLYGLKLSAAGSSSQFYVQVSSNDSTWTTVGDALAITEVAKDYTRRVHGSYRYVRLVRIGATDLGTRKVSIDDMLIGVEGALGNTKIVNFEFNVDQTYVLVFSDKNIAVFQNGNYLIDIRAASYTSAVIADIDWVAEADTLIIFHGSVATGSFVRGTDNDIWTLGTVSWTNIPTHEFGAATGGADEVQTLTFAGFAAADTFTLTFDGYTTTPIAYSAVANTTRDNIDTALEALANIPAAGVVTASLSTTQFTVTFSGTGLAKTDVSTMTAFTVTGTGTISITETTKGAPTGEAIWSGTRGYPRHGAFYQGRLYVDGGRSRPSVAYGSVLNDSFNFDFGEALDDEAIGPLAFQGFNDIEGIYPGRALMVFTAGGEYILPQTLNEPITPNNVVVQRQSSIGSIAGLRQQETEGGVMYVQRGGKSVQEFIFDDKQASFANNLVSLISSHLVVDPVDFSLRKATNTEDGAYLLMVLGDGSLTVVNILRSQGITAFTKQTTDGDFLNCASDVDDMYFVVQRTINSTDVQYLERFNNSCYMDCSTLYDVGSPTDTFAGLTYIEGEECRVRADESVMQNRTVSGGSITIERDAEDTLEVGLNFDPLITDLPVENQQVGTALGMPVNVSEIVLRLDDTAGIIVNGKTVSFSGFGPSGGGSPLDSAPTTFTGVKVMKGWRGWTDGGQVTITQEDPEPMKILALSKRVNI